MLAQKGICQELYLAKIFIKFIPMTKIDKTIEEKIRQICTTLKANGSGYYNLSEEQFEKLYALFDQEIKRAKIEELDYLLKNASGGGSWRRVTMMRIAALEEEK